MYKILIIAMTGLFILATNILGAVFDCPLSKKFVGLKIEHFGVLLHVDFFLMLFLLGATLEWVAVAFMGSLFSYVLASYVVSFLRKREREEEK